MSVEYEARLANAVERFRQKHPDRYEAIEMDVVIDLAVPLHYRLRGLPDWVRPLIAEKVAEKIRILQKWPSADQWTGK